jgi:hypothetical protein
MEDVRIGRTSPYEYKTVALLAATVPVLGTDKYRTAVVFQNLGTDPIWIRPGAGGQTNAGFRIVLGDRPLHWTLDDVGLAICDQWTAASDGAANLAVLSCRQAKE